MSKIEAIKIIINTVALLYSQSNLGIGEQYRGSILGMAIWPSVCPSYVERIPECLLDKDPSLIELNMNLEPIVTATTCVVA